MKTRKELNMHDGKRIKLIAEKLINQLGDIIITLCKIADWKTTMYHQSINVVLILVCMLVNVSVTLLVK